MVLSNCLRGLVDLFAHAEAAFKTVGDAVEEADVPAGTQLELFDDAERRAPEIDEVARQHESGRGKAILTNYHPGLEPERVGPQLQGFTRPKVKVLLAVRR